MDNSGSAFPRQYEKLVGSALEEKERLLVFSEAGLTKREWFAGMALSVIPHIAKEMYQNQESWDVACYASEAFKLADAMLAQSGEGK